jgi:hypothetical protein
MVTTAKRVRLDPEDEAFEPYTKVHMTVEAPMSHHSTSSALPRRSYCRSPTGVPNLSGQYDAGDEDNIRNTRACQVAGTIRSVFASMPEDILLDIMPVGDDTSGLKPFSGFREAQNDANEYSTNPVTASARGRSATLNNFELIFQVREHAGA